MKRQILFLVLNVISIVAFSQENHFSQFYNAPQYLNPAFAGDAAYIKVGGTSRIIKPVSGFRIINSLVQFDFKPLNQNSGFGLMVYNRSELLSFSKIQINYSYTVQLSKIGWAKGGLGISTNQRRSNANSLKYPDQYDNYGYTGSPTSENSLSENSLFPAITAGLILYNKYLWFSFAGDYLNRPKENFAGQKNNNSVKINAATGFLIPINANKSTKRRFSKYGGIKPFSSIGPLICFTKQKKYTEFSGGIAFHFQPVYGGISLRYQHDFTIESNSNTYKALDIILGYRQEEFTVAYSYDATLGNKSINQNGALVPLISQMLY
jgi:type IX secretion system PorP/SprF family membrane protein